MGPPSFPRPSTGSSSRVWLLPGSEDNAWNLEARRVYAQWCAERGIDPEVYVLSESLSDLEAETIVTRLLVEQGAPKALVFSLSRTSRAILKALAASHLRTADDVRLAALTDSLFSRTAQPPGGRGCTHPSSRRS
ncbi:substrate-binding domain-containing protein [uncultured Aeromicrobium sp.]|uniref:substrate-binding domain-containing protein n=1 Tax=uncultured Aeromicrobium sp. TaxID=337820 RepID=UPI00343679AA